MLVTNSFLMLIIYCLVTFLWLFWLVLVSSLFSFSLFFLPPCFLECLRFSLFFLFFVPVYHCLFLFCFSATKYVLV